MNLMLCLGQRIWRKLNVNSQKSQLQECRDCNLNACSATTMYLGMALPVRVPYYTSLRTEAQKRYQGKPRVSLHKALLRAISGTSHRLI